MIPHKVVRVELHVTQSDAGMHVVSLVRNCGDRDSFLFRAIANAETVALGFAQDHDRIVVCVINGDLPIVYMPVPTIKEKK